MVLNQEDADSIRLALERLEQYPTPDGGPYKTFGPKEGHLKPSVMLRCAIEYAPTDKGKLNIAGYVMNADSHTPLNQRLEEIASQIYTNLLIPSMFCIYMSFLTAVRAQGGRTPRDQTSPPSELPEDELQTTGGRSPSNRAKVTTFAIKLIVGFNEIQLYVPSLRAFNATAGRHPSSSRTTSKSGCSSS